MNIDFDAAAQGRKVFTVGGSRKGEARWGENFKTVSPEGLVLISITGVDGVEQFVTVTPWVARHYAEMIRERADYVEFGTPMKRSVMPVERMTPFPMEGLTS